MTSGPRDVAALVAAIEPCDDTERAHQADVLAWLASTPDVAAGGHVEPLEDPAVTAEREAREELGIEADFSVAGRRPVFVTVTPTVGPDSHTDVSLWYLLAGQPGMPIVLDPREFSGGRWWTGPQLESADPVLFDPGMGRFLAKVRGQPLA